MQKVIKAERGMDSERCQETAHSVTSSTSARCSQCSHTDCGRNQYGLAVAGKQHDDV